MSSSSTPQTLSPERASPPDEKTCVFAVLCPADKGPWAVFTCVLGFLAAFVVDGTCLSLAMYDGRFGMCGHVPSGVHTIEHMAVISLFRHFIEPFSCAYINRYGFRFCLLFGSMFSIAWIVSLIVVENAFMFQYSLYSAVVGGMGMGMINTSFFVLISSMFVVNRHTAHFTLHLGSITGMLVVPPLTEYIILTSGWKPTLYLPLGLIVFTLGFWLFVATPVPLKIEVIDEDPLSYTCDNTGAQASTSSVWNMVENKELRFMPFTMNTPTLFKYRSTPAEYHSKTLNWLHEEMENRKGCNRNLTNMCNSRVIGSRPMYRDDILFSSNVTLLTKDLKITENIAYLLTMTRVLMVNDLNEEKSKCCRVKICPTAMTRVLLSMFNLSILCEFQFLMFAACEALVHASSLIPFIFVIGPNGVKTSAEGMIILIAGCSGLYSGRYIGYLFHETVPQAVPLYHVAAVLIANGLALLLCNTTNNIAKIIPYFGMFGCLFGYYKSILNVMLYTTYPVDKFNNVHGHISLVRALSSFVGIWIAISIQMKDKNGTNDVYIFAGLLMMAGGVCVGLLQVAEQAKHQSTKYRGRLQRNELTLI